MVTMCKCVNAVLSRQTSTEQLICFSFSLFHPFTRLTECNSIYHFYESMATGTAITRRCYFVYGLTEPEEKRNHLRLLKHSRFLPRLTLSRSFYLSLSLIMEPVVVCAFRYFIRSYIKYIPRNTITTTLSIIHFYHENNFQ